MEFSELKRMALEIQDNFAERELKKYGRNWTRQEIFLGFLGDVGDLSKLLTAQEGVRDIENFKEKTEHEMADCLWSLLVLADKYNVDLEKSFKELHKKLVK